MPKKQYPFRFALIQFVPDSFREEPSNIGMLFQCEEEDFADCRFHQGHPRLRSVAPEISLLVKEFMREFRKKVETFKRSKGQLLLRMPGEYRDDMAKQDFLKGLQESYQGLVHFSEIRTGICERPEHEFLRLYRRLVQPRQRGHEVGERLERVFKQVGIFPSPRIKHPITVTGRSHVRHTFDYWCWNHQKGALIESFSLAQRNPKLKGRRLWAEIGKMRDVAELKENGRRLLI